jgi:uncharacterized protein Veg
MKDKAVEEIREIRKKISARYGHEVDAFLNHYRELQKNHTAPR